MVQESSCRCVVLLTAVLLAAPARAEEELLWPEIFRGTTEVNVVNVDVVVTDAGGRPVTGLRLDDFRLFEDGKPVAISNFYAVEAEGPVEPVTATEEPPGVEDEPVTAIVPDDRRRWLILFIDQANLSKRSRDRVLRRLRDFVRESWSPESRVMLVENDRDLVIRQGFTSDRERLSAALDRAALAETVAPRFGVDRNRLIRAIESVNVEAGSGLFGTTGGGREFDQASLTDQAGGEALAILPQIRDYAEQRLQHVRQTLRILERFIAMAAGLPGQKSVVYVSDGLPLHPGAPLLEAYARRFEPLGLRGPQVTPELESARFDASRDFEKLLTRANSGRVTFYTLYAGSPASLGRGSAETVASAGGNFASWNDSLASSEERNLQEPLRQMAEQTGGRHGLTTSAVEKALEGLAIDTANYYSLGYVADEPAEGRVREIRVEVPNRKWDVRFRRRFRDRSMIERAEDRTRAALLLDEEENPLEMELEAQAPQAQPDGHFVVPLRVKVPLAGLVLIPGDTEHRAKVSIFVAVRDETGRVSDIKQHLCPVRIPNSEILTARGKSAACGIRLLMRVGSQRIAVSLLDELAAIESTAHLDLDVKAGEAPASGSDSGRPTDAGR